MLSHFKNGEDSVMSRKISAFRKLTEIRPRIENIKMAVERRVAGVQGHFKRLDQG